nr:hypothetical protein [Tanacetum cinerariifolium]
MFEREKLSGNNFNDWFHQLKIVLPVEKKICVIEQPLPAVPAADSEANVLAEWNALYDAYNEELKSMFEKQAEMKGYVDQLERLGYMLPQDLIVGLILNGLNKDFAGFMRNYNMYNMGKTIGELHAMLIEYKKVLPKKAETLQLMIIKGGKIQKSKKKLLKAKGNGKANGKGNDKLVYIPKPKNPKPAAKEHPTKDETCHHCKEVGHWKRNCHIYFAELLKKKKQVGSASSSSIFTIELFAFLNKSWVYDTSCGTHICITKQGFREAKKLKQGALYLYVGNGVRAQVEAIGSFDLVLPNVIVICLDNCHYAPSITRGVVSVKRLVENRFVQCFTDFRILVSKNNVFYFNVIPSNGIYEIDMHDLVPNVNSIYNGSSKRAKHNLDSTYLWDCRLAHRSKKRIEKLQQERLLNSTDDEHVSKQGASYFITFTDDYSRYGYAYLLKHKHEVFETFKVFKNEVENQLEKTIKALRSDRDGEYISQEFKDYLKPYGIIQQLTPPYTPQHNDVSERRNRTLLDMVRSMINITTLSLSFWDYALESATHILNIGCEALVKWDMPDKLQQISVKFIFIGYSKETMGYYFYFPPENKIIVARYAEFFEKNLITQEVSRKAVDLEEIQDEDMSPSEITSKIPMEVEEVEEHSLGDLNEPVSYKAAMLDSESNKCIDAMNAEIQSMIDNIVWVLVDLHPNCKTVRSKWIFKKKTDMDVIVHTYKARLVAKGYTELYKGKQHLFLDKIYRDRSKRLIRLGQDAYMDKILKRYKMDNSKCGHIPMQERLDLNKTQGASTPKKTAMKNIPKYLRNTKDMFFVYGGNPEAELRVDCYCDAGFETDRDDTKYHTRYVFILNGGAVDGKSSKQSITAMSAT